MREHLAIYADEYALCILFSGAFPTRTTHSAPLPTTIATTAQRSSLSPARLWRRAWMVNELTLKSEASSVVAGGCAAPFAVLTNSLLLFSFFSVRKTAAVDWRCLIALLCLISERNQQVHECWAESATAPHSAPVATPLP